MKFMFFNVSQSVYRVLGFTLKLQLFPYRFFCFKVTLDYLKLIGDSRN